MPVSSTFKPATGLYLRHLFGQRWLGTYCGGILNQASGIINLADDNAYLSTYNFGKEYLVNQATCKDWRHRFERSGGSLHHQLRRHHGRDREQ